MASNRTLLSIPEASARLEVSPSTVRRWVRAGKLRSVPMPGGRAKVRADDVTAILSGSQPEAVAS
ncbi:helix-turn-helix domain-containing protein [Micromonospora eburnea]|uniref:helix-turn-helix domain-containing protein n=1 Tax=Micromonospora eburnea TaxID=227316 RepID=UPI000B810033